MFVLLPRYILALHAQCRLKHTRFDVLKTVSLTVITVSVRFEESRSSPNLLSGKCAIPFPIEIRNSSFRTVKILNIGTCMSEQTVLDSDQTALKEQSDQDLHCLPFFLHL